MNESESFNTTAFCKSAVIPTEGQREAEWARLINKDKMGIWEVHLNCIIHVFVFAYFIPLSISLLHT
jgi:hypothetical protein